MKALTVVILGIAVMRGEKPMKALVLIGILAAVVLTACGLGPSTPEVEDNIATAIAESEERTTEALMAQMVEAISEALAGSETRMQAEIAELKTDTQNVAAALDAFTRQFTSGICETDYGSTVLWVTVFRLIEYLSGRDIQLADVLAHMDGIEIDESYHQLSVCDVDDGRWVLQPQPDRIQFDRQP